MASEVYVRKLYGSFVPVDMKSAEAMEELTPNAEYKAVLTRPRNLPFHKKFMALVKVACDAWEAPELEHAGQPVRKNFDRFRKDLIILTGRYSTSVTIGGKLKIEADSISFHNMDETEFKRLYSEVIDIILLKVLQGYTKEDIDIMVEKILNFA